MSVPDIKEFEPSGVTRYSAMLSLQEELNRELREYYESIKTEGDEYLASAILAKVKAIVTELNGGGYGLGRSDYGGDTNYEMSEQWYCNGSSMGTGLTIHFLGYTAQVSWEAE